MVVRRSRLLVAVATIAGVAILAPAAGAQSLAREVGPEGTVARHAATGKVRFVGTAPGRPIARQARVPASARPEAAARAFVDAHEDELGARERDLVATETRRPGGKRASVRFQQRHRGVPVMAGELVVNLDGEGNVLSAGGELLPEIKLGTDPDVTAAAARTTARQAVAKEHGVNAALLDVSNPVLTVFDNRLLGGPGAGEPVLVWRMEVTADAIRELVLVNARTGFVELQFDQIADAMDRKVCDANNTTGHNPCTSPVRVEGGAATGNADVDLAYEYSGDTYHFMQTRFGRDSLDGAGKQMVSTVRWCHPSYTCPLANAFWDGQQMLYGQGYASADDVVGHEFAHGLTEFTSGLFYYYQSGALNESLSDVMGEFVDLANGAGNDGPSVKWDMGEDLPGGRIRDMENPPAFNDPDRMTSPLYWTAEQDSGGVHFNSGVNNKAAFLMVDGATFNGRTVTGIGVDKTAKIYYRAMTTMMTSASDYADMFNFLPQACRELIGQPGTSMTTANCLEVEDAVKATEMDLQPTNAATPQAPECAPGQKASYVYDDGVDTDPARWIVSASEGIVQWFLNNEYATSGERALYGVDRAVTNDSAIRMQDPVTIPPNAFFSFQHSYDFEGSTTNRWDGGVVEYSSDGTTWTDAGPLFTAGGYNGTISSGTSNPLGGRQGFTIRSFGYGASRANLSTLAGQSLRFRFRVASDNSTGDLGWLVDDIRIGVCKTLAPDGGKGSSAAPSVKGDFNGDGDGDVAVGIPGDNDSRGGVQVLYGTPTGLASGGSQLWSQTSTGIADAAEPGDGFGASLAVGDFDGDAIADLAIGVPGENSRGGAVHVLYGTPGGLSATNSQLWHQSSAGVPDAQGAGDEFGSALAAANLGNSTHADLAIGTPGEDSGAGKVHVLYGSASGVLAAGTQEWSESSSGIASTALAGDRFGASLAAADFGGATVGDLAIGVPGTLSDAGAVHALYGAASGGLSAAGSQYWSQASANVPDAQEAGDGFGTALAAADLGRTTQADLAIGAPDEDEGSGAVHVLYGAASGLATTGTQQWTQASTNVADAQEVGDRFGDALAAANLGKTAHGDLAIGVPGENGGGGAVHVLHGTAATGASASGSQFWSQNSSGIADLQAAGDQFGDALAAIDLGKSTESDLVVGTPGEDAGAGMIHVIYGTAASGLTAAESQTWNQNSAGLAGTALAGDRFGAGLGN